MPAKKRKLKKGRLKVKNDTVKVVNPLLDTTGSVHSKKVYPQVDGGNGSATSAEIAQLGMREHQFIVSNKPHTIKTEGIFNEMGFRTVVETKVLRQPYLYEDEVKKLGCKHWWPHREGDFTTIVNGNRFLLSPAVFEDMKDKGLVLGCSANEAHKYRS